MTNPDEVKEEFYNSLREKVRDVPTTDKLIVAGDINASIGREVENWHGVISPHSIEKCNCKCELLLAFCSECSLIINNTISSHKTHHNTAWIHPDESIATYIQR